MDKHDFIDDYLMGKHPIEGKKWELPTEDELDRDEALYDALLARPSKSPLKGDLLFSPMGGRVGPWRGRGRLWVSIAAVLIAVVTLFTWKSFKPQSQPQLAEKTTELAPQENTPKVIEKHNVPHEPTTHASFESDTAKGGKPHSSQGTGSASRTLAPSSRSRASIGTRGPSHPSREASPRGHLPGRRSPAGRLRTAGTAGGHPCLRRKPHRTGTPKTHHSILTNSQSL